MNKKYNEGYALPFVLVVSVVMCIIATTVMTFSLDNLQSQQNTIERMQAKYEAAAQIEKVVAVTRTPAQSIEENEYLRFAIPDTENQGYGEVLKVVATDPNHRAWIIVELVPPEGADLTISFSEAEGILTTDAAVSVLYQRYEIVDKQTADAYLEEIGRGAME
jgi:Na+-transporting NADH:ubiquinone oxidoreductase subunit NqrC